MSPSERVAELRRQRALLHDHLQWLDREITAAEAALECPGGTIDAEPVGTPGADQPAGTPLPPAAPEPPQHGVDSQRDIDALLERYGRPTSDLQRDVRKGCLLYFFAGCVLFAAGLVGLYFLLR